jgi:hypothetical protein
MKKIWLYNARQKNTRPGSLHEKSPAFSGRGLNYMVFKGVIRESGCPLYLFQWFYESFNHLILQQGADEFRPA